MNQGETTCFNYIISLIQICLQFNLQNKQIPPIRYYFITICYERLVDHFSMGDDLGSLSRYCIFNVYLIRVRPRLGILLCTHFLLMIW